MKMRLAGYVRVSTEEQALRGISLDVQEELILNHIERNDHHITRMYSDAGVSGGKPLASRPAGAQLVDALDRGEARGVVAIRLDRLFRSVADCANRTAKWREDGCSLHLLDMHLDTTTPMGELFITMAAAFAQLERRQAQARIIEALERKRQLGQRIGAIPYGFALGDDGKTLVIDEDEQEIVNQIINLRSEGLALHAIAAHLNDNGFPARGQRWHPSTIARIVKRQGANNG